MVGWQEHHCSAVCPAFFPLSPVPAVQALVFACMYEQIKVARLLLDRRVSGNANPPGSH
jgi:hypothetical protein